MAIYLKCSTPLRAQVRTLSALPPSEEDHGLNLLCSERELKIYIEHSNPLRQSEKLCVCFGSRTKGSLVTEQILSRWIIDVITLACSSTRSIASSWAWSSGVSIAKICAADGWASSSKKLARFYNLEIPALQARILST